MDPDAEGLEANQVNLLNWVKMRLSGHDYVEHRQLEGWSGALPFYRFRCPKHGLVENYPMGYAEILRCPQCDKEGKR